MADSTVSLDSLFARAAEICENTEKFDDGVPDHPDLQPMNAGRSLIAAYEELVDDNDKAFTLLHEMVARNDDLLDYGNADASNFRDFVLALMQTSDYDLMVIALVANYKKLIDLRSAQLTSP